MRVVLLALSAFLAVDQAIPQRDRPVQRTATGIVRGRVIAAASGDPLHRVQITLTGGVQAVAPAVTNTRGEFEVTNVPAGSYTVTARRLGYLTMQYGQRGSERGSPVLVAESETVAKIDFALVRGGVLAGLITDEAGMEYPGVRVDALEFRFVRGRRTPVTAATSTTNDLGQYRLSGLAPGSYLIRASTLDTWTGDEGRASYSFAPTYYPGATALSDGEAVTLVPAQELSNLNFGLRPGRTARINGAYQGTPAGGQQIHLSRITRTVGNAVQSSGDAGSTRTGQDGAFEFRNLAPGEYVVSTGTSDKDRGSVTVTLRDGDESTVVIGPRQPTLLAGTVRLISDQPPRFAGNRLRVVGIAADPDYVPPSSFTSPFAAVNPDLTFRYADLVGAYLFRLEGLPDDWMVSSVAMNNNDITDLPLDIGPGHPASGPLQITITDKTATVSGHVVTADGTPAGDSTIVVFAADPSRWTAASRFIKVSRPRSDGRFTVGGLVPGKYLAVARLSVAEGQWEDPAFLKSLVDAGTPFEARLEEMATIELRVERAR